MKVEMNLSKDLMKLITYAGAGIFATTIAIELNYKVFKTCVSYESCIGTYMAVGFSFIVIGIILLIYEKRKEKKG